MSKATSSHRKFVSCVITTAVSAGLGLAVSGPANAALEEVIVTAQKREQSVQEVPVAITALTQESLETNRVASVTDLSGLAPNLTARPATGGIGIASFSMRGVTSFGIVPGSDKEISIYLDGVYIGSPRGSIFSLPDIAQLEVLRGPQGTLFGRNATAGAINITTRDPGGELAFRQDLSFGNQDYLRSRTTIESPTWGPFSFLASYVKEERDGDIKNLGAGTVWDRAAIGKGIDTSPKTLGDKDIENYFFAAKFQPTGSWTMTYKYDKSTDHGTPNGIAPIAVGTPTSGGSTANNQGADITSQIYAAQVNKPPLTPSGRRPDAVNNAFTVPLDQTVTGHSLTTLIDVTDEVSVKNITAFRKSEVYAATDLTGLGGMIAPATLSVPVGGTRLTLPSSLVLGPGATGAPVCIVCTQNDSDSDQWSTEFQVNWDAEWGTTTVGALWFESNDRSGGPKNSFNTAQLRAFPGTVISAVTAETLTYNDAQSAAIYTQVEYHLTDEIDLVAGLRETRDRKSGEAHKVTLPTVTTFNYEKSRPSYVLGVNYKPTFDTLIYGKFSDAFVSGGTVADIPFDQEIAKSWEAGIKTDFLESRLRSNLSVFYVDYQDLQTSASGINIERPDLSTVIVTQGDVNAKGFEWEGSAALIDGLTLNASLGYTDVEFKDVNPALVASVGGDPREAAHFPNSSFEPILQPEWTGSLSAQYDSHPLFGQSYLSFNVNGNWHSEIRMEPNPARADAVPAFGRVEFSPASWVVNSRLALKDIDLGFGEGMGEVAIWGRNLTDNDEPTFALNFGGLALGANYMDARSYGVDFSVKF